MKECFPILMINLRMKIEPFKKYSILTIGIALITLVQTILSLVAIVLVFYDLSEYSLSLSSKGFSFFISVFESYKVLFGSNFGALTVLTIFLKIEDNRNDTRLKIALSDGNLSYKYYQEELELLKKKNEYLYRSLIIRSEEIFRNYVLNRVSIKNKYPLAKIMDDFFANDYNIIEKQHVNYKENGGQSEDYKSYSDHDSRDIFTIFMDISKYKAEDGTNFYDEFRIHYRNKILELRRKIKHSTYH